MTCDSDVREAAGIAAAETVCGIGAASWPSRMTCRKRRTGVIFDLE